MRSILNSNIFDSLMLILLFIIIIIIIIYKFVQNGKLGHSCTNVTKDKLYGSRDSDHAIVHLGLNVSSSAHNYCRCVVDGGNAMAAI